MHTPKETNDVINTKTNAFSLASDGDVEESIFFNAELKILYQQFLIFLEFMNAFLITL